MENSTTNSDDSAMDTRWEKVMQARGDLAAELNQMAKDLPGRGRKHLRSMSRWFRGHSELAETLARPDVLAVCLPLLKSDGPPNEQFSPVEIGQAAREGFCSMGRELSGSRRWLRLMLYPLLIILAAAALGIAFSLTIAPQFQEMFEEFGIELPQMTKLMLGISEFVRDWLWAVISLPLLGIFLVWIFDRNGSHRRTGNLGWIDHRCMSTRNAIATWAWHVSLLMDAGLSQTEAVDTAGQSSGNKNLRQISRAWSKNHQVDAAPNENPFSSNQKYQLLDRTMELPPSAGKIEMLRQVANYYWDRNRNYGDWWIYFLNAFILWMVGVAVFFAILSLFMPLIAIVSGLTGGK